MTGRWLGRLLWAATGLAWFIWLGVEDRSVYFVLALGLLISLSLVVHLPLRRWVRGDQNKPGVWASLLMGALSGSVIPLLAILLMLVKVSLHRHALPDFTLNDIHSLLATIHVWGISGGLMGAAWLVAIRSAE